MKHKPTPGENPLSIQERTQPTQIHRFCSYTSDAKKGKMRPEVVADQSYDTVPQQARWMLDGLKIKQLETSEKLKNA